MNGQTALHHDPNLMFEYPSDMGSDTLTAALARMLSETSGTVDLGKKADIVLLDLERAWNQLLAENCDALHSAIVCSVSPENVDSVMIDGDWIYHKGEFIALDEDRILHDARLELKQLLRRV
jgi:cytosine/adenosine deaminase-related metal-dependent hydrolase